MWWLARRGGPLHPGHVRSAEHPHLAVAPFLRGDPLDRVVAVVKIIEPGSEDAIGIATTARVLDHNGITMLRETRRPADEVRTGVVVGSAHQDRWSRGLVVGQVDIR